VVFSAAFGACHFYFNKRLFNIKLLKTFRRLQASG
jgi:hypothetical protein